LQALGAKALLFIPQTQRSSQTLVSILDHYPIVSSAGRIKAKGEIGGLVSF